MSCRILHAQERTVRRTFGVCCAGAARGEPRSATGPWEILSGDLVRRAGGVEPAARPTPIHGTDAGQAAGPEPLRAPPRRHAADSSRGGGRVEGLFLGVAADLVR